MFGSLREKLFGLKEKVQEAEVEVGEEPQIPEAERPKVGVTDKAKAFFKGEVVLDQKKLDDILWDFEMGLLENDVALEVAEKIIADLKDTLYAKKFQRGKEGDAIRDSLGRSLREILPDTPDLVDMLTKKPYVIAFVGINGTGKTTTIAKVATYLTKKGKSCVLAAGDTFRAGAIEQLTIHAENLGLRIIKHEKGSDPAAVAFDAIKHAQAKDKDVVLIDTAGRMETNINLLDEMKKIVRVAKPDLIIFVGDALTGNSAIDQAENFNKTVDLGGVILTKADADAKGGAAISIAYKIGKPILFLGVGQGYEDLQVFDPEWFVEEILGV